MKLGATTLFKMRLGLALLGVTVLLVVSAPAADGWYTYFSGSLGGNGYTNLGSYVPLAAMDAQANHDDYCVYRATAGYLGAPSASGNEYCSPSGSGGYVYQNFHCYGGYPASHNRHSFTISVSYTEEDNCV